MADAAALRSGISVAVVGICGAPDLRRCLTALAAQKGAPDFEVVVAYDPSLADVPSLAASFPDVRMVANEGQHTPLELASRALRESRGEVILLTEDHCVPDEDWVVKLSSALTAGRAAAGGIIAIQAGATAVDWAFYFVDFFRYAESAAAGPSPTLTVCNVAYRRRDLEEIASLWHGFFHETAINDALRERFGELWLDPAARVSMLRRVRLVDALYERYAFGRLFGCTRLEFASPGRRLAYRLFAPALPFLLIARMSRTGLSSPALRGAFASALIPLIAMAFAWSWGEWLGYLTHRRPRTLTAAPSQPEPSSEAEREPLSRGAASKDPNGN